MTAPTIARWLFVRRCGWSRMGRALRIPGESFKYPSRVETLTPLLRHCDAPGRIIWYDSYRP